jgi:hypothetical protein
LEIAVSNTPQHEPVMYYDKESTPGVNTPAEVCAACSDFETGHLVPASFCETAKTKLDPEPWA